MQDCAANPSSQFLFKVRMNSPKNRSALVRIAKKHCKNFLKSYNKIEKEYCRFFFQGVVRIIGNKNSKPRSSEIKRKQTTDTN